MDAVTGVAGDSTTFYFGSVGGGVWKTTNAGTTWNPIFDGQPIASIGAIAVAPSNPNVIYVGTGESHHPVANRLRRRRVQVERCGKDWSHIGLRETRQIAKILVDPRDPDVVYVAALGHVYGPNAERGVFRSRDGGRNWQKILFTTPDTGAVDLAWDPANPKVIFATMWNAHRPPWSQYGPIEGPGSGLWKTLDGGDHWTQIMGHGLPSAMWRRSGVAVTPGGNRVYLLLDAQRDAGFYRSDDGGANWTRIGAEARLTSRAWYFGTVTVDPKNPDIVYVPNVALYRSIQFRAIADAVSESETGFLHRLVTRAEQQRLERILWDWLQVERSRKQAFTVETVEQETHFEAPGLRLRLRVDRIDRLENGNVVLIDYKSGPQSRNKLKGERPKEPALLVYAASSADQVDGIFFAEMKPDEVRAVGVSREKQFESRSVDVKKHEWSSFLEESRAEVYRLAGQFVKGYAVVDPLPGVCNYCASKPLCRVNEAGGERKEKEC